MADYVSPKWVNKSAPYLSASNVQALTDAVESHGSRLSSAEIELDKKASASQVNQKADASALSLKADVPRPAPAKSVALNKAQPVGIVFGSSTVYGSGTPVETRAMDRFVRHLERKLQRWHGVPANRAPITYIAGDDSSPYVSGGSILNNAGLGKFSRLISADATVTLTSPYPSTGIFIGFREGSSVGNLTYQVDDGEPIAIPVGKTGSSIWTGKWSSPALARGQHSYKITASGGAQLIDFVHFYDETNTRGPILLNGGWGEETLAGLTSKPSTAARLKSINPDFIIVVTGSNEQGSNMSRPDFAAAVDGFNSLVTANTSGVTWTCYAPIARPNTPGYDRTIITDAFKSAVAASPATRTFVPDLEGFWTDNTLDKTVLGTLSSDNVHPASPGHAAIADILAGALGVNGAPGTINPANIS